MIKQFTLFSALALSTGVSQAQVDSLAGFDERAAIRASVSENFIGRELRVHLSQLKRNYINNKFGLVRYQQETVNAGHKVVVAACVNEDFESSSAAMITSTNQINGWTVTRGYNTGVNNNCNLSGCCPSNPSESELIVASSGYVDPDIGSVYPIYSVFGTATGDPNGPVVNPQITSGMFGNNFIRLNGNIAGDYSMERLSKSFVVSTSNALLRFAFISVQSSNHQCCDAGGFILKVTNVTTSTLLSSVSYSASGVSSSCTSTTGVSYFNAGSGTPASGSSNGIIFNKWHVNYIDLTPYAGQTINIEVTAGDCTAGGHYACTYFDAQCGPVEIEVNGQGKNTSCMTTATVSAPQNLNTYQWSGPNGFTSSAATFTTTTPGVYSLTVPQNPPYQALTKTIPLVISPANVTLTASKPVICQGDEVVLSASGLTDYLWTGGATTSSISLTPNITTTYTLTGTNNDECPGFGMITVTVSECTGIEKVVAQSEVSLFPNPNRGEFSLKVTKQLHKGQMQIKNNLGQTVYSQNVQKGENKIKTHGLASGVYYYSVTENEETITQGKFTIH